ncbi:Major Facilitator Superfamily protein [Rickettsiales bacterium Ac37b]|nr:Major Facilitator Superfamily protein [Rickettsiales bacterium Ac37b]
MMHDLMNQFNISTTVFGQFSGIYYIGYALMHLPIAFLLDRYGTKLVMTICILLTVIGLLPIIFTNNWTLLLLGRVIIGIGSSAAILGILKIVRLAFDEKMFTSMLSAAVVIGLIGGIYGNGPILYMCSALGYKAVIEIFALIGIILAFITYILIPKEKPYTKEQSIIDNIKSIFANYKVVAICCCGGLMIGPLEGFSDAWGNAFLTNIYNLEASTTSYLLSMIFIGMFVGLPLLSYIADKTQSYLASSITAGACMLAVFGAILSKSLSVNGIAIGLLLVGACSAYQSLIIYKASTYVTEHLKGLTNGIANMIMMSFGYGFHSCIGAVTNMYSASSHNLIYGVSIIPIALFIGVIGLLLLALQERRILVASSVS